IRQRSIAPLAPPQCVCEIDRTPRLGDAFAVQHAPLALQRVDGLDAARDVVREEADRSRRRDREQVTVADSRARDAVANVGRKRADELAVEVSLPLELGKRPLLLRAPTAWRTRPD